jgi:hypothetical protein
MAIARIGGDYEEALRAIVLIFSDLAEQLVEAGDPRFGLEVQFYFFAREAELRDSVRDFLVSERVILHSGNEVHVAEDIIPGVCDGHFAHCGDHFYVGVLGR